MNVFIGDRLMVITEDGFIETELFIEGKELHEGLGYIKRDFVYIYKGEAKKSKLSPGLYTKENGKKIEYIFVDGEVDNINIFNVKDVVVLDAKLIFENLQTNPNEFMSAEDLEDVSVDRDVFVPIIRDSDDFLKTAIKKAIIAKKINVKQKYKDRFAQAYQLTNRVHQLREDTKMSTVYFMDWIELLDLNWKLIISDNGKDPANPIGEDIVIRGDEF